MVYEDVFNIEVFPMKFFLENKVPQKKKCWSMKMFLILKFFQ